MGVSTGSQKSAPHTDCVTCWALGSQNTAGLTKLRFNVCHFFLGVQCSAKVGTRNKILFPKIPEFEHYCTRVFTSGTHANEDCG